MPQKQLPLAAVASFPPHSGPPALGNTGIGAGVPLPTIHAQCLGLYQVLSQSASCQSPTVAGEVGEHYQTHLIDEVDRFREASRLA